MSTTSQETSTAPLSIGQIAQRIRLIRGQRVILDNDLAAFYGETTKRFNQQVNRNLARFPAGFMFQLDEQEFASLRLQIATSNADGSPKGGRGGRRYAPLVAGVRSPTSQNHDATVSSEFLTRKCLAV
jgi:hypothetical protein